MTFAEKLKSSKVSFRLCLTTTDISYYAGNSIFWGKLTGKRDKKSKAILSPYSRYLDENSTDLKINIIDTIESLGAEWSSDEQAIAAVSKFIKHPRNGDCLRGYGKLALIVLSDEDERSVGGNSELSSIQFEKIEEQNQPENLLAELSKKFKYQQVQWNSVIVLPGDSDCEKLQDAQDSPSFPGTFYYELTLKTGGVAASICGKNYAEFFSKLVDSLAMDTVVKQ